MITLNSLSNQPRAQQLRQFLMESVLLASLGGLAGLPVGYGLMAGLKAALPLYLLPSEADVQMDARVLLFTAAIVMLAGILFGLAPAIHATHTDLSGSLKEGARGSGSGVTKRRLRNALVVVEVALAFVLLSGAGLLIRSFYQLQQVDPGFETTNVVTMYLPMDGKQYPSGSHVATYLSQVMERINAVPGVREAATTTALPLQGWGWGMPFLIAGHAEVDRSNRPACYFKMVSPSYVRALGMKLLKGRGLSETDTAGSTPVIVVNQSMVKSYFKEEDPIGKRILIQQIVPGKHELGPEVPWLVVGVVADEKVNSLDDSSPGVYVSYNQSPVAGAGLVVRGALDPSLLIKSIQKVVWELNKNQPLEEIMTLEKIKADSLGPNRLRTLLMGAFAVLALLLAAIGIYGVISYSVAQRTQEMGVRAALGATSWDRLKLVLRSGLALTVTGLAIGGVGAIALNHLLSSLLFGVSPRDPWTLAFVAVTLLAVAASACLVPAFRATKVDPIVALRYE